MLMWIDRKLICSSRHIALVLLWKFCVPVANQWILTTNITFSMQNGKHRIHCLQRIMPGPVLTFRVIVSASYCYNDPTQNSVYLFESHKAQT
jgi:hypothetical protein